MLKINNFTGALLDACCEHDPKGYTPQQIKLAITGSGTADKRAVAQAVRMRLGLTGARSLSEHICDALAIAEHRLLDEALGVRLGFPTGEVKSRRRRGRAKAS